MRIYPMEETTMAASRWTISDYLAPVEGTSPGGCEALQLSEWPFLIQARHEEPADPALADHKVADWPRAEELAAEILARKSKDLRVAIYLLEAKVKLHGFAGLRDGIRVLRSLIEMFWDSGLHPLIPEGELEWRSKPLEWLNARLPILLGQVALTARDAGENYSFEKYVESRRVGFERDIRNSDGDGGFSKKQERLAALEREEVSGEMFDAAVKATAAKTFGQIFEDFGEASQEFALLEGVLQQKFQVKDENGIVVADYVPNLASVRRTLNEIRSVLEPIIQKRRADEPEPSPIEKTAPASRQPSLAPIAWIGNGRPDSNGNGWEEAERLIGEGYPEQGLAAMARLAALEHGRIRFQRRLALAEICLRLKRDNLALTILEELSEQIKGLRLDQWEPPDLVARVWGNLYRYYRRAEGAQDRAAQFYLQLCHLDPWQAFHWEE
jgi:type VI secretion system ImpA family protein